MGYTLRRHRLRNLLIAAITILAVFTWSPVPAAYSIGLSASAPAPSGVGGGGGGGATFTCGGAGNAYPVANGGIVSSYSLPFALCSYDQWHYQYATSEALCPYGFDVWRFYGTSTGSSYTPVEYTASRVTDTASCQPGVVPKATAYSPSPADSVTAGSTPPSTALYYSAGQQYPYISGPGGATGATIYKSTIDGNYTPTVTMTRNGSACTSMPGYNANTSAVRSIFSHMAAGTASTAEQAWANSFLLSTAASNPGYFLWAYVSGAANADLMMNVNPAVVLDTAHPTSTANWTTLATYYGSGVPACSSVYQFMPVSGFSSVTTYPVIGECIMPINSQYIPWYDPSAGTYLPNPTAAGGIRYQFFSSGTNLNPNQSGASWEAAAKTAWRNEIYSEVQARYANASEGFFRVGQPYSSISDTSAWSGSAAASAAANGAMCMDASAATVTVPGNPNPASTTDVLAPYLQGGGSLNPQVVTIQPRSISCTNCAGSSSTPYAVSALTLNLNIDAPTSFTGCAKGPSGACYAISDNGTMYTPSLVNSSSCPNGSSCMRITLPSDIATGTCATQANGYTQAASNCTALTARRSFVLFTYRHTKSGETLVLSRSTDTKGTAVVYTSNTPQSTQVLIGGSVVTMSVLPSTPADWTPAITFLGKAGSGLPVLGPAN